MYLLVKRLLCGLCAPLIAFGAAEAKTLTYDDAAGAGLPQQVHDHGHAHTNGQAHHHGDGNWHVHAVVPGDHFDAAGGESAPGAATATFDEAAMDAVFAQSSFSSTGGIAALIDIRFLNVSTLFRGDLVEVTTMADQNAFFGGGMGVDLFGPDVVNLFFVDVVDQCGTFNTSIVGCGSVNGNTILVESAFAASSSGTELIAHELGHNLGLEHRDASGALMNPFLNNGTTINQAEVRTIFGLNEFNMQVGSLPTILKQDQNGYFIEIAPIIVAALAPPVPLPAGGALLLGGLGVLMMARRRVK